MLSILLIVLLFNVFFVTSVSGSDVKSIFHGDHLRFLFFDGQIRSYRVHVPLGYDGSYPVPLVLMLHGGGTFCNSFSTYLLYDFNEKADEEGFIIVYPNGERMHRWYFFSVPFPLYELFELITWSRIWNFWDFNGFDDVGFISNLIDHLLRDYNVDSSRVYVAGHSCGAMMSFRLGAELSDKIAAIAPVAGSIGGSWVNSYNYTIPTPDRPLPVVIIHGVKDEVIPYYGGWHNYTSFFRKGGFYMKSVNESVSFWVDYNQCDTEPLINVSSSGRIIKSSYVNGVNGTEVVLYSYLDGDHSWNPTNELSFNDVIWDFFKKHCK